MDETPAENPVSNDEILFRRVPETFMCNGLSFQAFMPNKTDSTGISLSRSSFFADDPVRFASTGRIGKKYYVARLIAAGVRSLGLEVVPRPEPDNPGHAEIPDLNHSQTRTIKKQLAPALANAVLSVEGPFPGLRHRDAPTTEVEMDP